SLDLAKFTVYQQYLMKAVKCSLFLFLGLSVSLSSFGQNTDAAGSTTDVKLIFPDSTGWNLLKENQVVSFQVGTTDPDSAFFSIEGAEELNITFDSLGNFYWQPSYDLVDR